MAPEKFVEWVAAEAGTERVQWLSTAPACLTETEAWGARRSRGETVDRVTSVLAPLIGQLGYRMAIEGRLTDAVGGDANYVRRSDAEHSWKDRTIAPAP